MPKISLHVEADSADEYFDLLAAVLRGQPKVTPWKDDIQSGTHGIKQDDEVEEPDVDTATKELITIAKEFVAQEAEKKPRKPRGPNKPKMTPVTEEAPEEVEHVGTVAVSEPTMNAAEIETLTRMDLGDTIAGYVRKYGINFAQTDVSKMLQDMFGADVRKKSDVPDDQPSLRKAISAITQATIDNPYNRKVDVNG